MKNGLLLNIDKKCAKRYAKILVIIKRCPNMVTYIFAKLSNLFPKKYLNRSYAKPQIVSKFQKLNYLVFI